MGAGADAPVTGWQAVCVCPKCGAECAESYRFCGRCGKPLKGAIVEEERGPGLLDALFWFLNILPGLMRPSVIIVSLLVMALSVPVGYLGVILFLMGGVIAAVMVLGFALMMWGTGWLWLLYGYLCLPSEALADLEGYKWTIWILLVLAPITLLFALGVGGG